MTALDSVVVEVERGARSVFVFASFVVVGGDGRNLQR